MQKNSFMEKNFLPKKEILDRNKKIIMQNYYLYLLEWKTPKKMNLETGRLVLLLKEHPEGLELKQLLRCFYPGFENASLGRQMSLKTCLEKVIQRARIIFKKDKISLLYCRKTKRYSISIDFL